MFDFLCPIAVAVRNYGLAVGLFALIGMAISSYFMKGQALMVMLGGIVLAVLLLINIQTIATLFHIPMVCSGL